MAVYTSEHVSAKLTNGVSEITAGPGEGNLSIDEIEADDRETTALYDRESYLESVHGRKKQIGFSIEIFQDGKISDASTATISDFIRKTGSYAALATVDPGGVVHMVDVVVTLTRGANSETITLNTCRVKLSWKESLEGNRISISGTCFEGLS